MRLFNFFWLLAPALMAQTVEAVPVISRVVERKLKLPGELLPYQSVDLHARVTGFVERVEVDVGSAVKRGQRLITLSAPEMTAQLAEAEAKVQAILSQQAEADAKIVAAESTHDRLKAASATPGAIAGNELVLAAKAVDAARAARQALEGSAQAAKASVKALQELTSYLSIDAPFDGVITERYVHPGALAGPSAGPLLKLEQVSRLRLVVAVPETDVSGIVKGADVTFTVPDDPSSVSRGVVARIPRSVDRKTRTMPVELDVNNSSGALAPGMYADVLWPVRRPRASLLVPPTAVVVTTERMFVIRVNNGKAEWVNVTRGSQSNDLVEISGPLQAGDLVVRRASDEIREGTPLQVKRAS